MLLLTVQKLFNISRTLATALIDSWFESAVGHQSIILLVFKKANFLCFVLEVLLSFVDIVCYLFLLNFFFNALVDGEMRVGFSIIVVGEGSLFAGIELIRYFFEIIFKIKAARTWLCHITLIFYL